MEHRTAKLIDELAKGSTIAAAKLISKIENSTEKEDIIKAISPLTGNAYVIGITGSPGVGKSTLTDKLVKTNRKQNNKVGIIAVDPTSPFSGGAILGDRIRLQEHFTDEGVFIRSMASRGHLGGISSATSDAVKILDAFGCDVIFIETVGVGQSEIEIVKNVDTTLLVLVPGMGDEIQAIKAGVMEIADIFVINKADKDGADRTFLEIDMLQNLNTESKRKAPIHKVIARDDEGVEQLNELILEHKEYLQNSDLFHQQRKERLRLELRQSIHDKLMEHATKGVEDQYDLTAVIDRLYEKKQDVYSTADTILKKILK